MRNIGALLLLIPASGASAQNPPPVVDYVLIDKSERILWAYSDGQVVRTYTGLQLGAAPRDHKQFEGDERTPEGRYSIDFGNPDSSYHLSLHISYPRPQDTAFAQSRGRDAGGAIFIHGQPNGRRPGSRMPGDWTDGCIAVSDAEIEELWRTVPDGTPIDIVP